MEKDCSRLSPKEHAIIYIIFFVILCWFLVSWLKNADKILKTDNEIPIKSYYADK